MFLFCLSDVNCMKAIQKRISKRPNWSDLKAQREKFEKIASEVGITKWQDWYNVTKRELIEHGAGGILSRYKDSNIKALTSIFPEHQWIVSNFSQVPKNYWDSKENQRTFFEQLAKQLNITSYEGWYKVKWSNFRELGAGGVLMRYKDSFINALLSIYPEYNWRIWKFERVPDGFCENHRKFFEHAAEELKVKEFKDWYLVDRMQILDLGGTTVLSYYSGSLKKALLSIFPEFKWEEEKFQSALKIQALEKYEEAQIARIKEVAATQRPKIKLRKIVKKNELKTKEEPKQIKEEISTPNSQILSPNSDEIIIEEEVDFEVAIRDLSFQRAVFEQIAQIHKFKKPEDWFKVKAIHIMNLVEGESILFKVFNGNYIQALRVIFPEHDWPLYMFENPPRKLWEDLKEQRDFLDRIGKKIGISHWKDWYLVTKETMLENGGNYLIERVYQGNWYKALQTIYSEYKWSIFDFAKCSTNFWDDDKNVKALLDHVFEVLELKKLEDWYDISYRQMNALGMHTVLKRNGGILPLLKKYYPEHNWIDKEKKVYPSKIHSFLFKVLCDIFPNNSDIHLNYIHDYLRFPASEKLITFDIYIPSLSIAFECQGEQHYRSTSLFVQIDEIKRRDEEKKKLSESANITLIHIPYWWDHSKESLLATIHKVRPDIIKDAGGARPIPMEKPKSKLFLK